ncbi:MAG: hypothetical protein J7L38_01625 [Thermoproteales archaeon]|nr:hypothetical protein [Thermoproteales archaeon]
MEACEIDVFATARNAGFPIKCSRQRMNHPLTMHYYW